MKALAAYEVVTILIAEATALQSQIGSTVGATGQVAIDEVSDHSDYGLAEVIVEEMNQAIDMVDGATNKIYGITAPTTDII